MSDSQEAKRIKRAKIAEDELRSAAGGRMWNADDFEKAANYGLDPAGIFVPGDTFRLSGIQDYKALGFANTSPDPQLGLDQYLGSRSETLQDFQARTSGLPLIFNADGTATFAPDAQKQTFSFEGKSEWWETAVPIAFAAFAGAGLGGFLPGTESVFTASASAGAGGLSIGQSAAAGLMEGVGGAAVGSAGATTAQVIAAAGAAGAGAGLLAENSFDTGAMQSILERAPTTFTLPAASSITDVFKTAGSVASSVGSIVSSAAAIDAATGAKPVLSAPAPSSNPLFINLGTPDMAKTATTQTATTPAPAPINLQSLLPIAVLVVAVLALSGELGGE